MEQDSFVKIENRELPADKFKNFDFDDINRNNLSNYLYYFFKNYNSITFNAFSNI